MKRKVALTLIAAMTAGMIMAGCGGSSDAGSSAASSAAASTAAASSAESSSSASSAAESEDAAAASSAAASSAASSTDSASASSAGTADVPEFGDATIPEGETLKIGYLAQNQTDEFCVYLGKVIEDEAKKYGDQIDFFMADAQSQAALQVNQCEDMVIQKPDVVIINAVDQEASAPGVQKLADAGIPIICLNTSVSNLELVTSYVGIDDKEVGMLLARMVGEALDGKGTVNVIQGLLGHPANERRWVGVQEEIEANWPDLKIGATQAADWDRGKAMNVAEDWISSGAQIDAVLSLNDEMAISAMNAFQAAGKTETIVVGADALDEALKAIKAGKMYGTVFQNGDAEGRAALEAAVCAATGVEIEKEYMIPNEIVTAENVDSYMGRNSLE